ncbi:MAG: Crp/Fnr family transcriptional regulator [Fimbriimonas sp.]
MTDTRTLIARSYLATGLSDEEVDRLVAITESCMFADGEAILSQFEKDTDLMILLEGAAVITSYLNEPIGHLKPYAVFGEVALFDQKPRSASITSQGDTKVLAIDGRRLLEALAADPAFAAKIQRNVIMVLCDRLRSTTRQLATYIALEDAI